MGLWPSVVTLILWSPAKLTIYLVWSSAPESWLSDGKPFFLVQDQRIVQNCQQFIPIIFEVVVSHISTNLAPSTSIWIKSNPPPPCHQGSWFTPICPSPSHQPTSYERWSSRSAFDETSYDQSFGSVWICSTLVVS